MQAERREAGSRLGAVPEQAAGVSRMSAKRRFCQPPTGVQGGRSPCVRRALLVNETCVADTARNWRCTGRMWFGLHSLNADAGLVKVPFTSSDVLNVASQTVNVLRGPPLNNPVFRGQPVLRTAFTSGQSACGRLDSASMPRFALFRRPGGITLSSFLRFTGLTRLCQRCE